MTTEHSPDTLRAYADETAALFLAVGLGGDSGATLFRQSHVPAGTPSSPTSSSAWPPPAS